MYEFNNHKEPSCSSVANLLSRTLYGKRFFPYYTFNLLAGFDAEGNGTVYGYVTSSYFSPFVTTVGLYDEAQNLLAVGKLAQPLPTSPTTDTTILVNIDK